MRKMVSNIFPIQSLYTQMHAFYATSPPKSALLNLKDAYPSKQPKQEVPHPMLSYLKFTAEIQIPVIHVMSCHIISYHIP